MGPADIKPKSIAFQALSANDAPPWASTLSDCIIESASDPASRFAVLATVDASGKPRVRSVVMRGCFADFNCPDYQNVISDQCDFWIITDARSDKIVELHYQPWAEICWYFAASRMQFRISGEIAIYHQSQCPVRDKAWQLISETAKSQFFWPDPKKNRDGYHEHDFEVSETTGTPPDTFVVLSINIQKVDQLTLSGTPQNRYLYHKNDNGNWDRTEVNP